MPVLMVMTFYEGRRAEKNIVKKLTLRYVRSRQCHKKVKLMCSKNAGGGDVKGGVKKVPTVS